MTLEGIEPLLANTYALCQDVSRSGDVMIKAERAVAFHRKLVGQGIIQLTSELEEKLGSCEEMLNAARAALSTGFTFKTAQAGHATSRAEARLPLDVLRIVLDHVEGFKGYHGKHPTLCSFALCNKTFCSLAQPRLFKQVTLNSFPELLRFSYALELQPKDSRVSLLVKSLQVEWNYRGFRHAQPEDKPQTSNNRLILMILARCPMVTALALVAEESRVLQSDVDALDGFLHLTPQLESLTFWLHEDVDVSGSFVSQDDSIERMGYDDISLHKDTIDKLRRLRSFALHTDACGWACSLFIDCFGPALRRIELISSSLDLEELLQIAENSPHLEEVLLGGHSRSTWADLARFIKSVGPSLTRFELQSDGAPDPEFVTETKSFSTLLNSLKSHAKAIEVLKLNTEHRVSEYDLSRLADPACLPRLRELTIKHVDCKKTGKEPTDGANPCEKAISAVLESHKTTLEAFSVTSYYLLLGNIFAQACLRLHQPCRIDVTRFAPETSLAVLECLYRSHHQLREGYDRLPQRALCRLNTRSACSACLLVNGVIISSHDVQQCPEAVCINVTEAESKQWPEAEQHGYCAQCFLYRPICLEFSRHTDGGCRLKSTIRPLVIFLAAQDPSWNVIGEHGEPNYWRPLLRSLLRVDRAQSP